MKRIFSVAGLALITMQLTFASPNQALSLVNINDATQQQLITLKGIGKKRAEAIIAYRQAHGKFHTLQDLLSVPGISKNLLDKIDKQNDHRISF